ncbi:hypothetical protein F5884DRAFT_795075 [Xylogone sp. PMI_703]|nr:hypothetical protein F5884DRAFT_795075 [Xylogone sp. PMI_703]
MDTDVSRRRKVRRGTRSCWTCKRRKVRCTFANSDDVVCISCRRRGTKCIGQEHPEESSEPRAKGIHMDDRIVHIETLIEQLSRKAERAGRIRHDDVYDQQQSTSAPYHLATPASSEGSLRRPLSVSVTLASTPGTVTTTSTPAGQLLASDLHLGQDPTLESVRVIAPTGPRRLEETSHLLYNALPSDDDVQRILNIDKAAPTFLPQCLTAPAPDKPCQTHSKSADLSIRPAPTTHPILLARWMIRLAILLHYVQPHCHDLSEPPETILHRLVDTASALVTTKDELIDAAEGLEAIVLEGVYQCNIGNLRRAWILFRRAMTVAQLMGVHRPGSRPIAVLDASTQVDHFYLWSRIVFVDRHFSLMLGMPQGFSDELIVPSDATQSEEGPTAELEQVHSTVASRIIQRNERRSPGDISLTLDIDHQLQHVANRMSPKWWLAPSFKDVPANEASLFRIEMQLTRQLYHYNLLNQLHLPYLLDTSPPPAGCSYAYSRYACVYASREIIGRFLSLPSVIRIVFCFRAFEFFVHMAGMTLLLAHLDSHRRPWEYDVGGSRGGGNLLVHQRLSDRAMIELVLERIMPQNRLNDEKLSRESHSLLRRLLAVEAAAAEGQTSSSDISSETRILSITIPYFGVVTIGPEGLNMHSALGGSYTVEPAPSGPGHPSESVHYLFPTRSAQDGVASSMIDHSREIDALPNHGEHIVPQTSESPLYPGLTASANDWSFQGVDMTFFNSIMRGGSFPTSSSIPDEQQQQLMNGNFGTGTPTESYDP